VCFYIPLFKITSNVKSKIVIVSVLLLALCSVLTVGAVDAQSRSIQFDNSLCLPGADGKPHLGVAGAFSGFAGDKYVVAGGANFPDGLPWRGGQKMWHNTLYIFSPDSTWNVVRDALPRSVAYGCSVTLPDGLLCIGGCDAQQCFADVFLLTFVNGRVHIDTDWPSLPVPLANATASLLKGKIYVAGGQSSMTAPEATASFFVLDLSDRRQGWHRLSAWPGEPRAYAVSAVQSDGFDDCFYLFSGRNFRPDGSLRVLADGYAYNPRLASWTTLRPSFPVMAATAVPTGANHILLLGGVPAMIDGSDTHPGFSHTVRAFHTVTQTLTDVDTLTCDIPVTTVLSRRGDAFWIGSGEIRPGIRTPHILRGRFVTGHSGMGVLNIAVIVLYFCVLAWMGFYFSRKQKTTDDYFRGGGRLPWWAVGLSIFGTSLSAITFMAIPAKAYATDWSYIWFNAGILMVVPLLFALFIPFYRSLNVTTAYEYLERRFNYLVRALCSVAFILFQIGRMGVVLFLPAIAINVVAGIDIFVCIALMGILSLLYTMTGGIEAVVWTDALQVVILLGGALLAVVTIVCQIPDGMTDILSEAIADHKFNLGDFRFDLRQPTLWTVLIATFFTNVTTYGTDQTMVQRYMTTATESQARRSVLTNALLSIPATLLFFFVGTALYVFYKHHPADLSLTISDADAIFPWYICSQLPPGVAGLLISGILAAAMSTLSSSMNSASTAYVVDIHRKIFGAQRESLHTARIATLVLGLMGIVFALMMATWEIKSLWDEFNKILGLLLGSFGGLFLLGMLTRRANAVGALLGIAGSIVVQLVVMQSQSVHLLLYSATGFISCFMIGYLGSLIFTTKKH
jgi:SSS family transporter